MNVKSVEKKEKSTVELTIEVSAEEFNAAIEKVYKKQRGSINVPGFRKGHAPRKIIEGMYGPRCSTMTLSTSPIPLFMSRLWSRRTWSQSPIPISR